LVLLVVLAVSSGAGEDPVAPDPHLGRWQVVRSQDVAQVHDGWSTPVYLEVSELGWGESIFVSPDGKTIWYMYYPGKDLLTDIENGNFVDDTDIYFSKSPDGQFRTQQKLDAFFASEEQISASGVMIDSDGHVWYNSNHEGLVNGDWEHENIYRDDQLLPFNDPVKTYANPHYCQARDELWFDSIVDTEISVLKHAAANGFEGRPVVAPHPINSENEDVQDSQPWLSADCDTLYFTSNRHKIGRYFDGPGIFRSQRLGEDAWSEPELMVTSRVAVGDPALTADGRTMFFVQHFEKDGEFRTGLFFTQKRR